MSCNTSRNPVSWELILGASWWAKCSWEIDGVKQPLDDYKARMHIRASADGDVLVELTSENGGITIDTVNKDFYIEITAVQTSALPVNSIPQSFMFSLELYDDTVSPVRVHTPLYGYFKANFPEITK